jgi:hypothetical protein
MMVRISTFILSPQEYLEKIKKHPPAVYQLVDVGGCFIDNPGSRL